MLSSRSPRPVSRTPEFVAALQAALSEEFPRLRFDLELAMLGTRSLELTLRWADGGGKPSSVTLPVDLFAPVDDGVDDLVEAVYQRARVKAAA